MYFEITYDKLDLFAYTNLTHIKGEIKGIAVAFRGLGASAMLSDDITVEALRPTVERAKRLAEAGIAFFVPYLNPWNWMNAEAVETTDAIIDAIIKEHGLSEDVPIISTGGSMGGMCALTYMAYAKRTPNACITNCPVCDVPFHFTERPDLPRTFYSAYRNSGMTLDDALAAHSPLHLADKLPPADYYIFHCECDRAVNIDAHSRKLASALGNRVHTEFYTIPDRGHCDLTPEAHARFEEFIVSSVNK